MKKETKQPEPAAPANAVAVLDNRKESAIAKHVPKPTRAELVAAMTEIEFNNQHMHWIAEGNRLEKVYAGLKKEAGKMLREHAKKFDFEKYAMLRNWVTPHAEVDIMVDLQSPLKEKLEAYSAAKEANRQPDKRKIERAIREAFATQSRATQQGTTDGLLKNNDVKQALSAALDFIFGRTVLQIEEGKGAEKHE